MMRRRHTAGVVVLLFAACSDNASHVLAGQEYLEARDCMGPKTAIDVASGPDPGTCAPTCILQPNDAGTLAFITTTCPPYSPEFDTTGKDPRCQKALAALGRDDECDSDGGSTHPLDAGLDAAKD
jgi:hypothetical protein